jgi:tripartite-type tricarboxylate transporter receptor subunit TctC
MNRREVLKAGVGSLSAAAALRVATARAAEWPTKQIRVIVPYAPGSATDLIPRTVGTNAVATAEPDGHTILVHSNALVTVPAVQAGAHYDPVRDFSGITPLGNVPLVLIVPPEKKVTSVQQLVAIAKAKPGSINYAAAGIGTPPHFTAERFRIAAGFEGQLVPFKGAPEALTEVLAGRVDFYFCPIPVALPVITEGRVLALAIGSSKRASALPNVPTTLEAGFPNSDFDFWVGAMVPKRTPRDIVTKLHQEISQAVGMASVQEKLAKLGVEPMLMTPHDFDARIARETGIAVTLAKAANIALQ